MEEGRHRTGVLQHWNDQGEYLNFFGLQLALKYQGNEGGGPHWSLLGN